MNTVKYFVVLFVITAQGPTQLGFINASKGNPQIFSKAICEAMVAKTPISLKQKGVVARCIGFPDVASM